MSVRYIDRVWANQELKGGRLLVMLALADHANDAGECWPSQRHLAAKSRLTERQLRRVITALTKEGYLAIAEKGLGRGKKTLYRLFPQPVEKADKMSAQKEDILSEEKADICDTENRTFCPQKSGHSRQQKADISSTKADICDEISSHARSESPIEPSNQQPSIESSSSRSATDRAEPTNEEEEKAQGLDWAAVCEAWDRHFGSMPEVVKGQLRGLLAAQGADAVIHGIEAAARSGSRNYSYIAKCARNYIPPAQSKRYDQYNIDLPGVHVLSPAPNSSAPPTLPAPTPHDDPWAVCLSELSHALPGVAASYLAGSRLEAAGEVDGVPLYQVVVEGRAAVGVQWLTHQAGAALRRKLSSILGRSVLIEIVAEEQKEELVA